MKLFTITSKIPTAGKPKNNDYLFFLKEEPEKNAFSGLALWFLHDDIMSGFDPFFSISENIYFICHIKSKKGAST